MNDLDSCFEYQSSPARMPVIIRAPQDRDEFAWHELWAAYLDFYAATVSPEAIRHTWRRIVAPAGPVFGRVALRGGTVVGFAICVVHDGTWSVNPTCYLEDFFVNPAARGNGVGRALLDALVTLGGERGWHSIYWHTDSDNVRARNLYDQYVRADAVVRYRFPVQPLTTP